MGFLDRLKASQASGVQDWKSLSDIKQLDQVAQDSHERPIVLFKHSTTCGISAGAKHRLESNWEEVNSEMDFYYLDLLSYRSISNGIAERWGVRHQSPQIIVIKNDKAVYDTSHGSINAGSLENSLAKL